MTLADEIEIVLARRKLLTVWKIRSEAGFHLPFNGELSEDERRMAEQCAFDGPASWEVEDAPGE